MNKKQYNNVIENTLKHEQTDDSLSTARAIFDNMGVALPQGDMKAVYETISTDNYMGWKSCSIHEAQAAADAGTAAIGISEDRIVVLSANDDEQPVAQTASVMTLDENTSAFAVEGMQYYSYSYGMTTGSGGCVGSTTNYQNTYIDRILCNIKNSSNTIIPSNKKDICVAITRCMLYNGYEVAFVAGLLANIVFEGSVGKFESSNYVANPKPDYLQYMDTEYNGLNFYLNNYSNKTIMEVNVQTVWEILEDLKTRSNNTWEIGNSRVGFGLGSIQWTFGRAHTLMSLYKDRVGNSTTITNEEAISAEVSMIINELQSSSYNWIISEWRRNCENNSNSLSAANLAGSTLCYNYLIPYNIAEQARKRGTRAEEIYSLMSS